MNLGSQTAFRARKSDNEIRAEMGNFDQFSPSEFREQIKRNPNNLAYLQQTFNDMVDRDDLTPGEQTDDNDYEE